MRTFTTPTLNITIKKKSTGDIATDLVFDYLIFTIKSNKKTIEKRVEFSQFVEGIFQIDFTQEETGSLPANGTVQAEINFWLGDKRSASMIKTLKIDDNLIEEVR